MLPSAPLKGIVEADETFVRKSCKGADFLPRKARHRGGKAKKRGLSSEQVCVAIAMDRTGNTISATVGKGPITYKALEGFLGAHVASAQTLCADAAGAYRRFTRDHGLELQELNASKGIRVKKGIYHIQHVNGHHHRLKEWLEPFHGVATRWLDNYLAWFRFVDVRGHIEPKQLVSELLQLASRQPFKTIVAMLRPKRVAGQPRSKRKVTRPSRP